MGDFKKDFRIISVQSAKGGVGKTFAALSLAKVIVEKSDNHRVFIFDMDFCGTSLSDMFGKDKDVKCFDDIRVHRFPLNNLGGNLLDMFRCYLKGETVNNVLEYAKLNEYLNDDKEDKHMITLIPSGSFKREKEETPQLMFDCLHAEWLCDFIFEIMERITKTASYEYYFIFDNPPGWSELLPKMEEYMLRRNDIKKSKFLFIASPDDMDIKATAENVVNLCLDHIKTCNTETLYNDILTSNPINKPQYYDEQYLNELFQHDIVLDDKSKNSKAEEAKKVGEDVKAQEEAKAEEQAKVSEEVRVKEATSGAKAVAKVKTRDKIHDYIAIVINKVSNLDVLEKVDEKMADDINSHYKGMTDKIKENWKATTTKELGENVFDNYKDIAKRIPVEIAMFDNDISSLYQKDFNNTNCPSCGNIDSSGMETQNTSVQENSGSSNELLKFDNEIFRKFNLARENVGIKKLMPEGFNNFSHFLRCLDFVYEVFIYASRLDYVKKRYSDLGFKIFSQNYDRKLKLSDCIIDRFRVANNNESLEESIEGEPFKEWIDQTDSFVQNSLLTMGAGGERGIKYSQISMQFDEKIEDIFNGLSSDVLPYIEVIRFFISILIATEIVDMEDEKFRKLVNTEKSEEEQDQVQYIFNETLNNWLYDISNIFKCMFNNHKDLNSFLSNMDNLLDKEFKKDAIQRKDMNIYLRVLYRDLESLTSSLRNAPINHNNLIKVIGKLTNKDCKLLNPEVILYIRNTFESLYSGIIKNPNPYYGTEGEKDGSIWKWIDKNSINEEDSGFKCLRGSRYMRRSLSLLFEKMFDEQERTDNKCTM